MEHRRKKLTRSLPIEQSIGDIKDALENMRCAVLKAPPGAGKTTRVPLALLDEPWMMDKKILLLEPRRLAVRTCAAHMADLLGQPLGHTIGYRIRMDKKIGPETRIEVITQGIFIRMIQNDPSLEGVGLVIFDEFHERNLQNDLGFALCLESLEALCEDLRLLVMSATMDLGAVSALLGDAPMIVSKGKYFKIETSYHWFTDRMNQGLRIENACVTAIRLALKETSKDMLVFLPGVGEIQRLAFLLESMDDTSIRIVLLYGNLSKKEQDRVFEPSNPGQRKIILATSIAETSVTIDGIGVVIDSGLMRVPRFSAKTGMTRLETIRVSKATADQRRGRAGRTGPGICYRLWSEYDHQLLKPFTHPEILSADLCNLVLELAAWGVKDPKQLKWLDPPDPKLVDQARQLLIMLGGLDAGDRITDHGKKMVRSGVHPRLAHMMVQAGTQGRGRLACLMAALMNERDILIFNSRDQDPDISLRLEVLTNLMRKKRWRPHGARVQEQLAKRIIDIAQNLEKSLNICKKNIPIDEAGQLLALAYPDRIAKKRPSKNNTFLLASGKGAFFTRTNSLSDCEYIVAAHLDGNPKNAKIFMGAPYSKKDLETAFGQKLKTLQTLEWDKNSRAVQAKEQVWFKKLLLKETKLSDIDPEKGGDIFIEQIKKAGLSILPWTRKLSSLRERAVFLNRTGGYKGLPDLSDKALTKSLDHWLRPFLTGVFSFKQLKSLDLENAFFSLLNWETQQLIKTHAPTHIVVPSGSKKPLEYSTPNAILDSPILKVRLQEMFSLSTTPKIAGSTIAVTLHLLSPAGRPAQITNDIKSFWKNTYHHVKKDLMGRYPKHYWPDDPLSAIPTNRVKPKKR